MDIAMFMTKKDWTAIFMASCMLILLLLLSLIGKKTTWVLIALFFIACCIAFYMAWIKKYDEEDKELENMLGSIKEDLFTKKSKVKK